MAYTQADDANVSARDLVKEGQLRRTQSGYTWRVEPRVTETQRPSTADSSEYGTFVLYDVTEEADGQETFYSRFKRTRFHLKRTPQTKETRRVSFTNSFERGALVGLMLGCISMVLFHQVALPASMTGSIGHVVEKPRSVATLASVSQFNVILPSARVYVLQLGPYPDKGAATQAAKTLASSGIAAELIPESKGYVLWTKAALSGQNANLDFHLPDKATKATVHVLNWSALSAPTTAVDSQTGTASVNRWLAAMVAALRVETGVVANETSSRDARQAVANALSTTPAPSVWASGSPPLPLQTLSNHLQSALESLNHNQTKSAEQQILSAWADIATLRESTAKGTS